MRRGSCGTGVNPEDEGESGGVGNTAECARSVSAGKAGAGDDPEDGGAGSVETPLDPAGGARGLRSPKGIRPNPRNIGL